MEKLIQRLRDSKAQSESEGRTEGMAAGRLWATDTASHRELSNLSVWWNENSKQERDEILTSRDDGQPVWELVATAILGTHAFSRGECQEFWDIATGNGDDTDHLPHRDGFVRGFTEGAVEVWYSVADQI